MCCCTCGFSALPERSSGKRAEMRCSAQWETGKTGLQVVRCFQKLLLWAQFLYLLISREALKSFTVGRTLWCPSLWWQLFLVTSRKFRQKYVLDCMYSLSTKIIYILTFPPWLLEKFLRATWGVVSRAAVFILPQIKLNSQLSHCAFF